MTPTISLPAGLHYQGAVHTEVEFLKTNGIAEKVFVKKLADKPYTWQARVAAIAIKRIGTIPIGAAVREEFINTGDFKIPEPINQLPLAELNTLLVEIHRNLWQAIIPKQEFICKFCSKRLENTIDLTKIDYSPEDLEFIKKNPPESFTEILVYLKDGFEIDDIKELSREDLIPYKGMNFNKLTFRVPVVKDAINHERFAEDTVDFWRKISLDCLLKIESVEDGDTPTERLNAELPIIAKSYMGIRFFDLHLSSEDLKGIREELTEYIPTLPFYYLDECPCDRRLMIPHIMEASGFFSE